MNARAIGLYGEPSRHNSRTAQPLPGWFIACGEHGIKYTSYLIQTKILNAWRKVHGLEQAGESLRRVKTHTTKGEKVAEFPACVCACAAAPASGGRWKNKNDSTRKTTNTFETTQN